MQRFENTEKRIYELIAERKQCYHGPFRVMKLKTKDSAIRFKVWLTVNGVQYSFETATTVRGFTYWCCDGYPGLGMDKCLNLILNYK
jgi:hypothetical protein